MSQYDENNNRKSVLEKKGNVACNIPRIVPETEAMIDQYLVRSTLDRSFSCDDRIADEKLLNAIRSAFSISFCFFIKSCTENLRENWLKLIFFLFISKSDFLKLKGMIKF